MLTIENTVEIEGKQKPALVAEILVLLYLWFRCLFLDALVIFAQQDTAYFGRTKCKVVTTLILNLN